MAGCSTSSRMAGSSTTTTSSACSSTSRGRQRADCRPVPTRCGWSSPTTAAASARAARPPCIVDGRPSGTARIDRTHAFNYSLCETGGVGVDSGSPVSDDYPADGNRVHRDHQLGTPGHRPGQPRAPARPGAVAALRDEPPVELIRRTADCDRLASNTSVGGHDRRRSGGRGPDRRGPRGRGPGDSGVVDHATGAPGELPGRYRPGPAGYRARSPTRDGSGRRPRSASPPEVRSARRSRYSSTSWTGPPSHCFHTGFPARTGWMGRRVLAWPQSAPWPPGPRRDRRISGPSSPT